jgi:hypothetical protein
MKNKEKMEKFISKANNENIIYNMELSEKNGKNKNTI